MRVFCVSNELFSVHHNGQTPQAEAWTSLSGIPSLRDYCETVPADAQTRITNKFVEHGVQSLITSIRQWCLTGLEPVTAEKGITIRKVLSNALASFLQVSSAHRNECCQDILTWNRISNPRKLWSFPYKEIWTGPSTILSCKQSVSSPLPKPKPAYCHWFSEYVLFIGVQSDLLVHWSQLSRVTFSL